MAANLNRYEELFNEFAETIEKLSNGYDLFVQSQQQANDALTIMRSQSQLLQQAATSLRSLVETILSIPEYTKQQLDAYLQQLHQAVYVPIEESLHAVEQLKNQLQQAAELSDTQPLLEQLRTYNAQMEVLQRTVIHHIQQQIEELLPHLIEQYGLRLDNIATKLSTNLGNETKKMLEAAEMVRSHVEKTVERHHDDVIHLVNTLDTAVQVLTGIETPIKDTSKSIQVIGKFISTIAERLTKIEQQLWTITDALETLTASTNAIATSVTEKTDDIRHHVLHHKRYLLIGSVAAITAVALLLYALIG